MADMAVKTPEQVTAEGAALVHPVAEAAKAPPGPGGLLDVQQTAGNQAAQQAVAAQAPEPSGVVGHLASAAIGLFKSHLTGTAPQQRIAVAAIGGFVFTLAKEVSLKKVMAGLKELAEPRNMVDFTLAFEAGSILGMVSPVTDLFGILVLAEQMEKMATDLGRAAWEHPEELADEARALGTEFRNFLAQARTNLNAAELLKHLGELSDAAEKAAGAAGSRAGHAVALHFSGKEDEEEQPLRPVAAGPAAALEEWATETRKKLTDTQWSRLGYNVGYDIGAVVSNTLLAIFSMGAGEAVAAIGAQLGRLGGILGRAGNVVRQVGEGIAAVEALIAALMSKPMKWLEPLMKPFFALLERLKGFLQKMLGFVEKSAAKATVAAVEKSAAKAASRKSSHRPAPSAAKPPATRKAAAPVRKRVATQEPKVRIATQEAEAETVGALRPEPTAPLRKKATAPVTSGAAPRPSKAATAPPKKKPGVQSGGSPTKSAPSAGKKTPEPSGHGGPVPVVERIATEDGYHPRAEKPDPRYFSPSGAMQPAHHHVVDQYGRPLLTEGWWRPEGAARHADQRWMAEHMLGKQGGTEASHLIAAQGGGSGRIFNLVPLPRALNQGEIKALESILTRETAAGRAVYVQAYADYAGPGWIPGHVEYRVFVKDGNTPRKIFEMSLYPSH